MIPSLFHHYRCARPGWNIPTTTALAFALDPFVTPDGSTATFASNINATGKVLVFDTQEEADAFDALSQSERYALYAAAPDVSLTALTNHNESI